MVNNAKESIKMKVVGGMKEKIQSREKNITIGIELNETVSVNTIKN